MKRFPWAWSFLGGGAFFPGCSLPTGVGKPLPSSPEVGGLPWAWSSLTVLPAGVESRLLCETETTSAAFADCHASRVVFCARQMRMMRTRRNRHRGRQDTDADGAKCSWASVDWALARARHHRWIHGVDCMCTVFAAAGADPWRRLWWLGQGTKSEDHTWEEGGGSMAA
jgi:hypothetical protein